VHRYRRSAAIQRFRSCRFSITAAWDQDPRRRNLHSNFCQGECKGRIHSIGTTQCCATHRFSIACKCPGSEVKHNMLLENALQKISGIEWTGDRDADIRGIAYDSRSVQKGDLFVAIKGGKTDGAQFVKQAISMGAIAVASELRLDPMPEAATIAVPDSRKFLAELSGIFYDDPCSRLKLTAITGTKGKTTTTYLMESIFRQSSLQSCLAGTIEMRIGEQKFHTNHTTPEASDLLKFFRDAVDQGCTHGVLEVSSHALALKRVFGAKFAVGVFMNLTHDHLGRPVWQTTCKRNSSTCSNLWFRYFRRYPCTPMSEPCERHGPAAPDSGR